MIIPRDTPGVPRRVQPTPLYELNFTKTAMQLVSRSQKAVDNFFSPKDHARLDEVLPHHLREESMERRGVSNFPITEDEWQSVLLALPPQYQFYQWSIFYDTASEGCSLNHFYRCMNACYAEDLGGIGLFVVHEKGEKSRQRSGADSGEEETVVTGGVIGCFTPIVPCQQLLGPHYGGSPETLVFCFEDCVKDEAVSLAATGPEPIHFHSLSSPASTRSWRGKQLRTYHWCKESEHNRFVLCQSDGLSIGGGSSGAAIWVDSQLHRGSSSLFCDTFHSPALFGTPSPSLSHAEFDVERMIWLVMNKRNVLHVSEGREGPSNSSFFMDGTPLWTMMDDHEPTAR